MNTHANKTQENKSQSVSNGEAKVQSSSESTFQFVDNRPEVFAQRKLQEMANNSPQVSQLRAFQDMANNSPRAKQDAQLKAMSDNYSAEQQQPIQKKENKTGLPDNLKTGMENLSGISLDDVKVHRNSDKPAQLSAHAYAQGTDIHLASGQEKHLPHEAWHVVQQKQGRVKPTIQMKGKVNVNNDDGLEREADLMGSKANKISSIIRSNALPKKAINHINLPIQAVWDEDGKWDELIDGVQWHRDSEGKLWFEDKNKDFRYEFWSDQVHSYTPEEWDNIEIELSTPEINHEPALEKVKTFSEFKEYEQLILKGSRDRPAQLFDINGDPINSKDRAQGVFMIDPGMSKGEAANYEKVRAAGVRVPRIYGWNAKGAIVQFLPNQTTVTAQMASIDKAVESTIKRLKLIQKWNPQAWQKALVDLNILIKTGYHSGDLQFMVDNDGGRIYVMDLETDKGPRFENHPDANLVKAKEKIQQLINEG